METEISIDEAARLCEHDHALITTRPRRPTPPDGTWHWTDPPDDPG